MIGVILTGYGGPSSLEEVEPFLSSIAGGRRFTLEEVERAKGRYREIGGRSPLNEITAQQAGALERELNRNEARFTVRFGMLHLPPRIPGAVNEIINSGINKIAVVTLAPFRSRVSTAAYFAEAEKELKAHGNVQSVYVSKWNTNPQYIRALADGINSMIERFPESGRENVNIIFSIHSLPEKFIREGDQYVDDINETIGRIIPIIKCGSWRLAFQSRGRGDNWLGPDTETVMRKLRDENKKYIVIAPIGFISDHVETLYDIDITYRKLALELGVNMKRVQAVNDSPLFISALAGEIMKAVSPWL